MVSRTILVGNVGNDPEITILDSGKKIASFSLATSESYKDKNGEKQTNTSWHNIVIWGSLSDIVEKYVNKGDKLYLEGKNDYIFWEHEGVKRYKTNIVCNQMTMLGGKKNQEQE